MGHETGGVEEYAGLQKISNSDVDTFANFGIPAPAGVRETYCLELAEATTVSKAVRTKAFPYANGIGGSARIYLTNGAANPAFDFLRLVNADGSVTHARVRLRSDGKISLIDANAVEQAVSADTVSAPEWLKLYWKLVRSDSAGKLYVWLIDEDGNHVTAFESDADFSGGSGDVAVEMWGQLGTATVPCNIYWCDLYALYGVSPSTNMQGLVTGGWEVLGPYQTDHASSAVDAGSGPLDSGLWEDAAETPTGLARIGYHIAGNWGCRKTNGTTKYGPNGDSRVNGEIKGASWVYTIGAGNVSCYYGHLGDYTLDGGIYTRFQNAQFILDAADSRCPTTTEEFLQGFKCQAGGGRASLIEAWSFLLHVPPAETEKRAGLGTINRTTREVLAG